MSAFGMGGRRSGGGRGVGVLKERANMSFMLVVMFFAVFGLIVLTEIFLIDDRHGSNVGGTGALGGHRNGHRSVAAPDRPDYEEVGAEDYASLRGSFDDHVVLLVKNADEGGKSIISDADPRVLPSLPPSLEARLPHLNQSLRLTHADWLPVTNTRFKFFVYSAYYDDRLGGADDPGVIRVIGATKTRGPDAVWCRLWYNLHSTERNGTASITVPAKVKVIRENWSLKYSACFVICPLRKIAGEGNDRSKSTIRVPDSVSVVARLKAPPTNRILVQNRPSDRLKKREPLGVCVKPLHFEYNRVLEMIEFIELHRLLGATHVTLYNDTLGPEAGCVLRDYESRALATGGPMVTLLPWHRLDMVSQREIRTEGLFAALNDCLYRSMYKYELVALIDLDEFIIPRHNETILDLVSWMGKRIDTKPTGAFSFQNAFFYLQWDDDPSIALSQSPEEAALITLRKTRRKVKLHPHKQRSKYICRPENVVEAGNHFVWEFVPGHGTLNVPPDAAILQHYRVCEFGGDDCVKTQSVVDKTAYRYRRELAKNVRTSWRELKEKCSLPDLDAVPIAGAKTTRALKGAR